MPSLSVDFFGNLTSNPMFWKDLLKHVKLEGYKIYVISGLWPDVLLRRLEENGYKKEIHFDGVFSILSHLSAKGCETFFDEDHDSWYSDKDKWWESKAEICKNNRISVHMDNDIRFAQAFSQIPTRFLHTANSAKMESLRKWLNSLKLSNTFEDHEVAYNILKRNFFPT